MKHFLVILTTDNKLLQTEVNYNSIAVFQTKLAEQSFKLITGRIILVYYSRNLFYIVGNFYSWFLSPTGI